MHQCLPLLKGSAVGDKRGLRSEALQLETMSLVTACPGARRMVQVIASTTSHRTNRSWNMAEFQV